MKIKIRTEPLRVVSFDCETVPVWFGPGDSTRAAVVLFSWSELGSDIVQSVSQKPWGVREYSATLVRMAESIREVMSQPGVIYTGHYIGWADLPWMNATMYRVGLPPLPSLLVHDTGKTVKMKDVPKGLGEMIAHFELEHPKVQMMEGDWQDLELVRHRCEQDVVAHKEVYVSLRDGGYLQPPRTWRP